MEELVDAPWDLELLQPQHIEVVLWCETQNLQVTACLGKRWFIYSSPRRNLLRVVLMCGRYPLLGLPLASDGDFSTQLRDHRVQNASEWL